ncbi:conserved unknown protein [Ectocarpus siliculosus]|uniref:PHD-type domain-containing protein n=1 Tax=Ectocarpus siliculosus TaxID=2880 RepID=D8LBA9_ECTSI|nr:conserved unknown protein [Ectocarpus siliculosus]|eukprot:CBN76618.1 conserved unknown protein [Ectocarpus siliculosus]
MRSRPFWGHGITGGGDDHGGGGKEEAEGTKSSTRASLEEELSTTETAGGITSKVSSSTAATAMAPQHVRSLGESRRDRPPPPPPFGIAPPPALTAAASTALAVAHRDRAAHAACQPARGPLATSTVFGHYPACGHHADGGGIGWVDVRHTSGKGTGASSAARDVRRLGESRRNSPPPPSFSIAPPTALTAAASTAIAMAYRHQEELAAHAARQEAQDTQAAGTMKICGVGCGHNVEGDHVGWVNIRDVSGRGMGVSTAARYLRSLDESRQNRRSPLVSIAPPTALTAAASTALAVAYRDQLAAHAARQAARVPLAASTMNVFGHYPGGGHHGEGDDTSWVDIRDANGKGTGVSSAARRSYPSCSIVAASMAFAANQPFRAPPVASAAETAHHLVEKGAGGSSVARRSYPSFSMAAVPVTFAANQSFGAPPAASAAVTAYHLGGGHLSGKGSGSSGAVRFSSAAGSSTGAAGEGTDGKPAHLERAGTQAPKSGTRKPAQKRHPWGGKDWAGHPLSKKLQKHVKENDKAWRMQGGIMMGADGSHFFCSVCGYPGELTCCDECPRVFHLGCLRVRLNSQQAAAGQTTDETWHCPVCTEGRGNQSGRRGEPQLTYHFLRGSIGAFVLLLLSTPPVTFRSSRVCCARVLRSPSKTFRL